MRRHPTIKEYSMSIFYDLKRFLLQKFLELVPSAKASEVVYSTPITAVGTTGKECFVTLTAGSESRTFAVDRADLGELFKGHDPLLTPITTTTTSAMLRDLTQQLSKRFGLPLEADDVADLKLPRPYSTVHVKAATDSLRYRGEFKAHVVFSDLPQYPAPLHEFLFEENAGTNTGTSNGLVSLEHTAVVGSENPLLVTFPQAGLLGDEVGFDFTPNFTLDFTIVLSDLAGDVVVFSVDPLATQLSGPAFGFRAGRFCIFNDTDFTTGGAWDKATKPISANVPTQITLRCLSGMALLLVDGKIQGNFPIGNQTAVLGGFGSTDPGVVSTASISAIGGIRYWPSALAEIALASLLGDSYSTTYPTHWWPFNGDYSNIGSSGLPWQAPMTFVDVNGKTMAASNSAAGMPFGAEFDCTKDFTLQFEYHASAGSSGWEGMFSNSNVTANVPGQIKFWNGGLHVQRGSILPNWPLLQGGVVHKVTLMGVGDVVYMWSDERSLDIYATVAANVRLVLTHFGKAVQSLSARHRIANLKFWRRSFKTPEELAQIVGPTAGWSTQKIGGFTGTNGTVGVWSMVDGNLDTSYGGAAAPTVTTNVSADLVGKRIFGLRYWFKADSGNYKKKLKYIRVEYYNGTAWVTHETLATKWCTTDTGYPSYETLLFNTPLVLQNTSIRFVGTTNYGDKDGYFWCTELGLLYDNEVLP